jgi:hypothetical protein
VPQGSRVNLINEEWGIPRLFLVPTKTSRLARVPHGTPRIALLPPVAGCAAAISSPSDIGESAGDPSTIATTAARYDQPSGTTIAKTVPPM